MTNASVAKSGSPTQSCSSAGKPSRFRSGQNAGPRTAAASAGAKERKVHQLCQMGLTILSSLSTLLHPEIRHAKNSSRTAPCFHRQRPSVIHPPESTRTLRPLPPTWTPPPIHPVRPRRAEDQRDEGHGSRTRQVLVDLIQLRLRGSWLLGFDTPLQGVWFKTHQTSKTGIMAAELMCMRQRLPSLPRSQKRTCEKLAGLH